jgi:uncharacterized membrane protein
MTTVLVAMGALLALSIVWLGLEVRLLRRSYKRLRKELGDEG